MNNLGLFTNYTLAIIKESFLRPQNIQLNISQKKIAVIALALFVSLALFSTVYYVCCRLKKILDHDRDSRPGEVFEKNVPLPAEKCKENEVEKKQEGEKAKRDESLTSLENLLRLKSPITVELKGSPTMPISSAFDVDIHNQLIVYGYGEELRLHHLKTGITQSIPVGYRGNLFAHILPDNQLFVGGNFNSLSLYKLLPDDFIPKLESQQSCSEIGPLTTHLFVSDKRKKSHCSNRPQFGFISIGEKINEAY